MTLKLPIQMLVLQSILICYLVKIAESQTIACNETQTLLYHCEDKNSCIARSSYCDNTTHCPDGSDEMPHNASTSGEGINCVYRRSPALSNNCLLPARYKCDHELDCINGWDECGCNHTFSCDDESIGCVLKVSFCDGNMDCSDNSDERLYNRTSKVGFQCPVTRTHRTNNCILPDRYICDGDSDCDFGIDECFCDFSGGGKMGTYLEDTFSNDKCFRCLDGSLVIPNIFVCDRKVHCEDFSDECLCRDGSNQATLDICNSICSGSDCDCKGNLRCSNASDHSEKICVEPSSICDNNFNCANQMDEKYCADSDQTFECFDKKKKIKDYLFCNGPRDCDDGSDELHCANLTDYYCTRYRGFFPFVTNWDDPQGVSIPPGLTLPFDYPFYVKRCDGVPMCGNLDDECDAGCAVTPHFCQLRGASQVFRCPVSGSLIIGKEVCDGKPTCNDTRPELSEDELFCPNRFYCSNNGSTRLPIHIPMSSRCNSIQECDDQSDEMGCGESTHFYCQDGGSVKFTSRSKVCDGTKDCRGGSDECKNCNPSPFSSDEKLINSRVLIVFLWIIGIIAVLGNITVFIHQTISLTKPKGKTSKVATCNRILVLNLALSDSLVGIYLVALGIKDATVTQYCLLDQEWRTGATCSALGSIALLGTETSVFILAIMTSYRLYLIIRPFQIQKIIVVKIAVIIAWVLAALLAFIPFAGSAQDYFVSCVWYRSNEFVGHVCRPDLIDFMADLVKFEGQNQIFSLDLKDGYTWENMFNAMKRLNSSYIPERFFGYYSAHSVCLPRLFPDPSRDQSWGYSLFIILLNFFAFVFILVSYLFIYRETTKKTQVSKGRATAEDRATALQRKITRIVLTDFCCWMPICIMAFIRVSGRAVSDDAYAVTAIILLPINAAMNPFLYSNILDIIWDQLEPVRNWFNETACGKRIETMRESRRGKEVRAISDTSQTRSTAAHNSSKDNSSQDAVETTHSVNQPHQDSRI